MKRAILAIVVCVLSAPPARAQDPGAGRQPSGRCDTCHGMQNLAVRDAPQGPVRSFSVPLEAFHRSVHASLTCQQCHQDTAGYPHRLDQPRQPVSCDQDCHATGADGQPYTHAAIARDVAVSVHVTDDHPAAHTSTCLTCHGSGNPHAIAPVKGLAPAARMATCVACHDDEERMARAGADTEAVASYRRSFHSKAITFGATSAAVCQDCHTAHRVLPASDARSSIAAAALPATCGQSACHPGARANFAVSGANHLDLRVRREPLLMAEEWMFWLLTSGTMAMLVVGIVLDLQKKFGWVAALGRVLTPGMRRRVRPEAK
ncbi:MAG: hypothetical protein AB7H96_15790 [Vicinamibacterales bacterium]